MEFCSAAGAEQQPDFTGYTLLLPVVGIGNAGQLAADLLINTLQLPRAGTLHHPALLPCVGAAAFAHAPGLTAGLELFADSGRRLASLQQRAPAAPGLQAELAAAVAAWVAQAGFKQVWVLGSLDATFRTDRQLAGPQLRFWTRDAGLAGVCSSQGLRELEAEWFARSGDKPLEGRLLPPWPLLLALGSAGMPSAALLSFSLEGDNLPEAYMLGSAAARVLGLGDSPAWEQPCSWRFALGREERPEVY